MTVRSDLLQSAKTYFSRELLLLKFSIVWLGRDFTHVTGSAGAWNTNCVINLCIMLWGCLTWVWSRGQLGRVPERIWWGRVVIRDFPVWINWSVHPQVLFPYFEMLIRSAKVDFPNSVLLSLWGSELAAFPKDLLVVISFIVVENVKLAVKAVEI